MENLALTNERINAQGGLNLIGKLLKKACPIKELFPASSGHRSDRLSDGDILTSMIGLLTQRRTHYEDIELFRQPEKKHKHLENFASSLGLSRVPSESSLRGRLAELAAQKDTFSKLDQAALHLLKAHTPTPLTVEGIEYIPLDADVSPFDNSGSHREKLGHTYKGHDGFAPIFAYLGTEGWLLNHELRPGVQHCQKNTPAFLEDTFKKLAQLNLTTPILARLDSGNDSADTLAALRASGHHFLVKRNLRKENPVKWLSHAMSQSAPECPRPGKEIYTGTVEHLCPGGEKSTQEPLTVAYRIERRTIDRHGQTLLLDDLKVETYWTNLGHPPEVIIGLYHDHGTSEQYHSELKSDLNLERFPSGSYEVNTLFLHLGTLAYNLLRALDQRACAMRETWPKRIKKVKRRRVGSIVRDLILVAAKRVSHAGKDLVKIAASWPWSGVMLDLDRQLST